MLKIERPKSFAEQVSDVLRAQIISGERDMGEALSETKIAKELGVSRTPVREAFARLELVIEQPACVIAVEMRKGDDIHRVQINTRLRGIGLPDVGKPGIKQHLMSAMTDQRGKTPFSVPAHVSGKVLAQNADLQIAPPFFGGMRDGGWGVVVRRAPPVSPEYPASSTRSRVHSPARCHNLHPHGASRPLPDHSKGPA